MGRAGKTGDNATSDRYTTVKEAKDFINLTGVDALAVAIGTAHGAYKEKPCLDIERLKEIRNNVVHRLFFMAARVFLMTISERPLKRA